MNQSFKGAGSACSFFLRNPVLGIQWNVAKEERFRPSKGTGAGKPE
jgi:hypothetical protein